MDNTLSRNWWALILRGAIGVLFAFLAYALGEASITTIARTFAVFAIAEGALAISASSGARAREERPWGFLTEGCVSIAAGLVALIAPWSSGVALVRFIAAWIAVVGLLDGASAIRFRHHLATPRLLIALSVVSVVFALAIAIVPAAYDGGVSIVSVWAIGAWAAFFGFVSFLIGFVLRRDVVPTLREDRVSIPVRVSRPSLDRGDPRPSAPGYRRFR